MKNVQSIIFRGMSFLMVGVLMVAFPAEQVTTWLVRIIGALFLIPGLVSIASYFRAYSSNDSTRLLLPVIGVGSVVLGGVLIAMPGNFIKALMYVLAAALLLAGVSGFMNNLQVRKYNPVGFSFYVVPALMCLVALFIIINPWEAMSIPFLIFGVASIIYGFTELVYAIHFRKVYKQVAKGVPAEPAEAEQTSEPAEAPVQEAETVGEAPEEDSGNTIDFSQDEEPKEE